MISSYNAHTEPFFKNLKLLKIQDILTLQTLKIYHKFRKNNLPNYIQNWPLFQNSSIHNHNTRGANALHKNRCSHVFAQKSLKLNITNIVNGTPDIILDKIDTHSLNGFTNYVKLFLLQTYQDTCTVPNCYIIMFALKYFKHIKQLYFVFYFVTTNVLDLPFIVESKCMYDYD